MKYLTHLLAAIAAMLIITPASVAQEEPAGLISMHVSLTPKAGHQAKFYDAMKAHIQWRAENGDPWEWTAYGMENGTRLSTVHFRSGGHKFADIEAYNQSEFGDMADDHYTQTVAPHVAETALMTDRYLAEISAWPTEGDHPLIQLYEFELDPAKYSQWRQAIGRIHQILQDNDWPEGYGWTQLVSGGPINNVVLAIPMAGWGHMDEDRNPYAFVAEAVGEEEASALWASFYDAVEGEHSWAVRQIPELSLHHAQTASAE